MGRCSREDGGLCHRLDRYNVFVSCCEPGTWLVYYKNSVFIFWTPLCMQLSVLSTVPVLACRMGLGPVIVVRKWTSRLQQAASLKSAILSFLPVCNVSDKIVLNFCLLLHEALQTTNAIILLGSCRTGRFYLQQGWRVSKPTQQKSPPPHPFHSSERQWLQSYRGTKPAVQDRKQLYCHSHK